MNACMRKIVLLQLALLGFNSYSAINLSIADGANMMNKTSRKMFGRWILVISLIVGVLGCGRPKYVEEPTHDASPVVQEKIKADCSIAFTESKYCVSWYWEFKPTSKQPGSLIFKIFRLNQFDQTAVEVDATQVPEVMLWMPSMGHGSTPTQTSRLDIGTYRASNVFFIMPGDWEIRFLVKDGQPDSKQIDGAIVAITI